jgi:hypothetical protein
VNSGYRADLQPPDVARADRMSSVLARRERFEQLHPDVMITTRMEGASLVFEVAEPGKATVAWGEAAAMLDDLEKRYSG